MSLFTQDTSGTVPTAVPGGIIPSPPRPPAAGAAPRRRSLLLAGLALLACLGWVPPAGAANSCSYDFTPTSRSHGYGPTTSKVSVVTGNGCGWVVINNEDWLTVVNGASGLGNGDITYLVSGNPNPVPRIGVLYVLSLDGSVAEAFTVTQSGVNCTYSISPSSRDKCSMSMTGTVQLSTQSSCPWSVVNPTDWIVINAGFGGVGSGKIHYTVLANPSTQARTGVVMIGTQPFTIRQAGLPYGCPTDKTVECGAAWDFDPPTQIGTGNLSLRVLFTVTNNLCGGSFTATRTWEITDNCNDQTLCQQTISSVYRPPLVICPPDLTVANLAAVPPRPRTLDEYQAAGGQSGFPCGSGLGYVSTDGPVTGSGCGATLARTHIITDNCSTPVSCVQVIHIVAGANGITANGDAVATSRNVALPIAAGVLLANDVKLTGGPLALNVVSSPTAQGGTATLTGSGVLYVPPTGFFGTDTFTYTVQNECGDTATSIVTVTVNQDNHPPLVNDDTVNTEKNTPLVIATSLLLTNDTDVDGDLLTITFISPGTAKGATLQLVGGQILYTPPTGFIGTDTFTYTADDGHGGSSMAIVTVIVGDTSPQANRAPIVANTNVQTTLNIPIVLARARLLELAVDPDGDVLTLVAVRIAGSPGAVALNSSNVVATPQLNFVGSFDFTFEVSDGRGGIGMGTVTVLVQNLPLAVSGETPIFNPQTGLFEQRVTVYNEGGLTVPALSLAITGLSTNIRVWNATSAEAGTPSVLCNQPLDPGQSITMRVEYYVPDRQPFTPVLTVRPVLPIAATAVSDAGSAAIDRCYMDTRLGAEPRFVIEFTSIPGRTYTMLYSDDATHWTAATPTILATANRTQWYDDGPPKTRSKPGGKGTRFYRVLLAP